VFMYCCNVGWFPQFSFVNKSYNKHIHLYTFGYMTETGMAGS
jgi:hypothetical protein